LLTSQKTEKTGLDWYGPVHTSPVAQLQLVATGFPENWLASDCNQSLVRMQFCVAEAGQLLSSQAQNQIDKIMKIFVTIDHLSVYLHKYFHNFI